MMRAIVTAVVLPIVVVAGWAQAAVAEITDIQGFTQATVTELRNGDVSQNASVNDSFPATSELPLQVVALLLPSLDPNNASGDDPNAAAAAVAAQFEDPRTSSLPNPQEFAINLTLNTVASNSNFTATAISQETRSILFSEGEAGVNAANGQQIQSIGRVFLDGALAVFAAHSDRDLTGAFVRLKVHVDQVNQDESRQAVFDGAVELSGTSGGADASATGDFPLDSLVLSDLGVLSQDFATFRLLVIPNITIDYNFTATVGQPFDLEATVTVEAANLPDQTGVAAVIGTPTDTLNQVIGVTQGVPIATKVINAVTSERQLPTGTPAFPSAATPLALCAPLGFGALFLLSFAVFATRPRPRR